MANSSVHDIAKELKLHSDQVRASLRAIPTEIALDLTREQLMSLVQSITEHAGHVFNDGYRIGKGNKDG